MPVQSGLLHLYSRVQSRQSLSTALLQDSWRLQLRAQGLGGGARRIC